MDDQEERGLGDVAGMASRAREESLGDRVGLSLPYMEAPALLEVIAEAEAAGMRQIWTTQVPTSNDALTVFAAAAMRTERIRLGTSIVPIYPRHPLALAQQAATVAALAPGRLRLGVGPSHRPAIESTYGLRMEAPLAELREYVEVLRAALWEGKVEHQGRFYTARATFNTPPRVPLLVSALGEGAFRLAGEVSDGAISWNSPARYLIDVALPAMRAGAAAAGRATPPLVAHVWVALTEDVEAARSAAKKNLAGYARLPFYTNMWAAAGYALEPDGGVSDALVDSLLVAGGASTVEARLNELIEAGLGELLLTGVYRNDPARERTELIRFLGRL